MLERGSQAFENPLVSGAASTIAMRNGKANQHRRSNRGDENDRRPHEIEMGHERMTRLASRALSCTWRSLFGATCVLACALVGGAPARAASPERYDVRARIDVSRGELIVDEQIAVRVEESESSLRCWVYADRLSAVPHVRGERTWRWLYPGEIDLGEVSLETVTVDGNEVPYEMESSDGGVRERGVSGADLVLPLAPGPSRTVSVRISLRIKMPSRFGRMGRVGDTWSLAAPWYPLVIEGDAWRMIVPHRIEFDAGENELWLSGEQVGSPHVVSRRTAYVPASVAPRLHRWQGRIAGIDVVWSSFEPLYTAPSRSEPGVEGVADLIHIDRIALLREALEPVVQTARWLGVSIPPRLDLLMVPSRTELVATAPSTVLVSDRFGQVFPIEMVREFHLRALRRALFAWLSQPLADRLDAPIDRGLSEELRSVVLLELDGRRRATEVRTPEQLLSAFAFHPAIDQLLYAPQVAFEDVYFPGAGHDPYRDDPNRARLGQARAERVLESARDVLSEDEFGRFIAMVANGRRSIRSALERANRASVLRLPMWLESPRLEVNYHLGDIRSERAETGYRHTIEVIREGAHRVEPVVVEVEDESGARGSAVWDGTGERGVVEITTPAARRGVRIDPRQRLPQSAVIAEGHPRADDATDQPFRPPIFTGFAFDVLASEANVTGLIEVALRRRYDLEHTFSLRALRTAARTGGRFRYLQSVGPKVHNNRRSIAVGGGLGFYYVHPGFGASQLGGYATDLELLLSIDTRGYVYDWREGFSLAVQAQVTTTVREDGSAGVSVRASARGSHTWEIGNLQALVLVGSAGVTVGPVLDADRQSMGGRYGLRGFANDELLGTSALYAVLEHRVSIVTDLAWNLLHAIWARELQFAWWLGAGVLLSAIDGRDVVGAAEAGIGLRIHYEYAGIQPGLVAIDFAVPISRWVQTPPCFFGAGGECNDRSAPFGFYISVDQYY